MRSAGGAGRRVVVVATTATASFCAAGATSDGCATGAVSGCVACSLDCLQPTAPNAPIIIATATRTLPMRFMTLSSFPDLLATSASGEDVFCILMFCGEVEQRPGQVAEEARRAGFGRNSW